MVTERAYTVKEIDRMRMATQDLCAIQTRGRFGDATVEDRLRTYMMAGVAPEELELEYNELRLEQQFALSLELQRASREDH
jgi:hypothetical protein